MLHGSARPCTRRRGAVLLAVATLATVVSLVAPAATPPAAAGQTAVPITTFSTLAVDPASGRVFLSGDDKVVAYAPNGTLVGTVADVYGAGAMAFSGGSLWVTETTAGSIAKVNPTTLAKVDEFAIERRVLPTIAAVAGKIWFRTIDARGYPVLSMLDPATRVVSDRGQVVGFDLVSIPGSTTRLISAEKNSSSYGAVVYDLTQNPVVGLGGVPFGTGGFLQGIVATDADTFITASGYPGRFEEVSTQPVDNVLYPTGASYRAGGSTVGVAYSAAAGGVVAGTTSSPSRLVISRRGSPQTTHAFDLPGSALSGNALGLSPTADRAYVVTQPPGGGALSLNTFAMTPSLTSATTTSVPRGVLTTSVLTGPGLGSITSAKLGGAAVDFTHDGGSTLVLDIRTSLPVGSTSLVLHGSWGDVTVPFTVTATPTGTLTGTIRSDGVPVAGAEVLLTDDRGATRTATTVTDGTFSIAGVPDGEHRELTASHAGQSATWRDLTLLGGGPWVYDADLLAPPPVTLERRRDDLPAGEVRRVVADPATGRVFVAVGDEIAVFDGDGRPIKLIHDQWAVHGMQVVGSKLYAMLRDAGRISVVDIPTATVAASIPIDRRTTGDLAVAGNRAFFSASDDQWTTTVSVDLTTGVVAPTVGYGWYPKFGSIDGAPQQYLSWSSGQSPGITRWDATTPAPTVSADEDHVFMYDPVDLVASASANRLWGADGTELNLTTMQATGVKYPSEGIAVARAPGHGGLLAFGSNIAVQGRPVVTHVLPEQPAARASALNQSGTRSYVATQDGQLVIADLAPVINQLTPGVVDLPPATVRASGAGLGATTAVEVDGAAVGFEIVDADHLDIAMPALPDGIHSVVARTPWGTTAPLGFTAGERHGPFSSWTTLVKRVYVDLTRAQPSPTALRTWQAALDGESKTAGDLVEALRRGTDNTTNVDPVARLYRAFFGRTPDAAGLKYWVARKRTGASSVTKMANTFAASNEFRSKYGKLSNRAFVTRIYRDVLERSADPSGVSYWTGKLDRKERSRGQVMVGFSESSEYRRKQAENTDVAVVYIFLLGRAPTVQEVHDWVARQRSGTSQAALSDELLASPGYAEHITG